MLRLWLPLIKNTKNQGFTNVTIEDTGITPSENGKLGASYEFTGGKILKFTNLFKLNERVPKLTVCGWINKNVTETAGGHHLISMGTNSFFRVSVDKGNNKLWGYCNYGNGVARAFNFGSGALLDVNKWYHIAVTFNNGIIKSYINGVLSSTADHTPYGTALVCGDMMSAVGAYSQASTEPANCKLNDIRVYDEVLSVREINKLSKALIMHYPLTHMGINPNLSVSTSTPKVIPSDTFTGIVNVCPNLYLTWFNIGTGKAANKYYKFHVHFKVSYSGLTYDETKAYAMYVQGSGNVNGWTPGFPSISIKEKIRWGASNSGEFDVDTVITLTDTHLLNASYALSLRTDYITGGTLTISEFKIEPGTKYTGWAPYYGDINSELRNFVDDYLMESDMTGYGNNAIMEPSNFPVWAYGNPFNNGGYQFSGTNIIKSYPGKLWLQEAFTVSVWSEQSGNSPGLSIAAHGGAGYPTFCIDNVGTGGLIRGFFYDSSNRAYVVTSPDLPIPNTWNHIVCRYDKTKLDLFINGVLVSTNNAVTDVPRLNSEPFNLGGRGNVATWKGMIGDFRLYGTALSDEDIQRLYAPRISIDAEYDYGTTQIIEAKNENIISDWTDVSLIKSTGWEETFSVDPVQGVIILGVTNGWASFYWDIGLENCGVPIIISYEYKIVEAGSIVEGSTNNYFRNVFASTIEYGNHPKASTMSPELGIWKKHTFRYVPTTNTDRYVGIVIREIDNAGKHSEIQIKNLSIRRSITPRCDIFGNLLSNKISEIPDMNEDFISYIPELGDTNWYMVCLQDLRHITNYFNTSDVLDVYAEGKYSDLGNLEKFRGPDGKFEFVLVYPYISDKYNRWKQTDNPVTTNIPLNPTPENQVYVNGYEAIHIDWTGRNWGGLCRSIDQTAALLSGSVGSADCHYAIGAYKPWLGGIPGPNTTDTPENKVILYVRVDNIRNTSAGSNIDSVFAREFIEE